MRTWFIRIVEVFNEDVPMYMVEGMEVESDGYTNAVSDFHSWGVFPTKAEAEDCRKSVLMGFHKVRPRFYHKARLWSNYAQELYDGSLC